MICSYLTFKVQVWSRGLSHSSTRLIRSGSVQTVLASSSFGFEGIISVSELVSRCWKEFIRFKNKMWENALRPSSVGHLRLKFAVQVEIVRYLEVFAFCSVGLITKVQQKSISFIKFIDKTWEAVNFSVGFPVKFLQSRSTFAKLELEESQIYHQFWPRLERVRSSLEVTRESEFIDKFSFFFKILSILPVVSFSKRQNPWNNWRKWNNWRLVETRGKIEINGRNYVEKAWSWSKVFNYNSSKACLHLKIKFRSIASPYQD